MKNFLAILFLGLLAAQRAPSQTVGPPAFGASPAGSVTLTVPSLLQAWGAAEAQRQCFTLDYEGVCEESSLFHHPKYAWRSGTQTHFSRGEVRFDGTRVFFSNTEWTESTNKQLVIPKEQPRQRTWIWDGKVHYFYTPGVSAVVTVGRGFFGVQRMVPTALFRGYLCDLDEPVDLVVDRSATTRLRPKPEMVEGASCRVIEASGREGQYTLWIDTERGNNLVRAEVHLAEGNTFGGKPLKKGYQLEATLSQVQLQEMNGTWFPTGYTYDYSQRFPDGYLRTHSQYRFSRIKINPNLQALQAFTPAFEDGLRVKLAGSGSKHRYTWRQGEILDEQGRRVEF